MGEKFRISSRSNRQARKGLRKSEGTSTYLEHVGHNHKANLGSANVDVFEFADLAVASSQRNVLHVAVHAVLGL